MKKTKKLVFQWDFFHILNEVYIYKKKGRVIEIPEWKLKKKLARNTIFEGNQDKVFAHFVSKIAKSDYFRGFYFSQSLCKVLGNNITSVFLGD